MSAVAERIEDEPVEVEQQVTPLELFFDLVFVFAITQVTGFVSADATWTRLIEGLAILAALWFAWESYVWLANSAASDEGAVRVVLLFAMGALLIVSLAVPRAFGDDGLVFGVAYFVVRAAHICAYLIVARGDEQLRGVVVRLATTVLPGAALLVVAGALDGTAQALCWVGALAIDYGGLMVRGVEGWRVAAKHFAERHGLIIIIALGESIVALGVGAGGLELDAGLIAAALLGIAIASAMWWAYFDLVALVAERRLRTAPRDEQVRIARDSFTYLHLPMVAGIIVFALGVKKTLAHVDHELDTVPAVALCGGAALYFLALSAFKRRNIGSFNYPRLVAASALVLLAPIATEIPALVAVGLVAAISVGLVAYEFVAYAEARDRIRHGSA
jgi:low temperature requirement protein LtrA